MNREDIVEGATYLIRDPHGGERRFQVDRRAKGEPANSNRVIGQRSVMGKWLTGPMKGKRARLPLNRINRLLHK